MDMSLVITGNKSEFLKQLHHFIEVKLKQPDADMLSIFVDEFFEQYPLDELAGRSLDDVFGLVNDAFAAIGKFSKRPSVSVYNPSIVKDHWQCAHSVIFVHCKNMPFLMDSVRMALTNSGISVHAVNYTSLITERDKKGDLSQITPSVKASHLDGKEALLYFEISHLTKAKDLKSVESAVRPSLKDITLVNTGYSDMLKELQLIRDNIDNARKRHKKEEIGEANQFLSWLMVNNFTFLGYAFCENKIQGSETPHCTKSYGLLKNQDAAAFINETVTLGNGKSSSARSRKSGHKNLVNFSKLPIRSQSL